MKHLQRSYRFGCILFFVILCGSLFGQTREIDSLKNLINICKVDTTKTRLLNDLGIKYWNIDLNKSIDLGHQSISLANKLHYFSQLARSYNVIGATYHRKGELKIAYSYFINAINVGFKYKSYTDIERSLANCMLLYSSGLTDKQMDLEFILNKTCELIRIKGLTFRLMHVFFEVDLHALSYPNSTRFNLIAYMEKCNMQNDKLLRPFFYYMTAVHYYNFKENYKSIGVLKLAMQNTEAVIFKYMSNSLLSLIYYDLRRYQLSEYYAKEALENISLSNDICALENIPADKIKLGIIYVKLRKYKEAYVLLRPYADKFLQNFVTCENYTNLAEIYLNLDSLPQACESINKSLDISNTFKLDKEHLAALIVKSKISIVMKNRVEMIEDAKKIQSVIERVDDIYLKYEGYKFLVDFYKKENNLQKALMTMDKFLYVNKEIFDKEITQNIEELNLKNRVEKKDSQIIEQQNAINNRNTIIAISSTVVILIVVLLIIIILLQRKKTKLENINRHKLENELQLKTLQSKVIPHFTKNVLSAIGYLAMSDKLRISHYIAVFSRFTSLTLENADKNYNTLQNEIRYIENYLELEQLRFEDRFEYVVTIDPSIDLSILIPSMALHTYCDNAIRHGLVNKQGVGKLVVEVGYKVKGILISVTDDGVGREKAISLGTRGNGMGLSLIDAQIEFYNTLNLDYITQKIIDLKDADGNALGTRIELFIPESYKFE